MPTRSDIVDWVRNQTLVEADDFADAKVVNVINQGIREVAAKFPWPYLATSATITTVAAQQAYALPSDYLRTHTIIEAGSRRRLRETSPSDAWGSYGGSFPASDHALEFFLWGTNIYFIPTPSTSETDAYTHYYYRAPTILTNDGDSPEFDAQFHMLLADYAIARVWEREEDFTKAQSAQDAFNRGVEAMARYYLDRAQDRPMVYGESRSFGRGASTRRNLPILDGA